MKRKTISTSEDLLHFYPRLENESGWKKFAVEFDKLECRKNRMNAARACKPPKRTPIITDILNQCVSIRGMVHLLPEILDDETHRYSTPEEVLEKRLSAATSLAENVECILSDTREGDKLRDAIKQEIARIRTITPQRNIMEAWKALISFIVRKGTLPTKQQLNWEANHIAHGRMDWFVSDSPLQEGAPVEVNGKKYRAYGCYDDWRTNDQQQDFYGTACKLVPEHEWNCLRWDDPSNASHIWKDCGFSGLPDGVRSRVGKRQ